MACWFVLTGIIHFVIEGARRQLRAGGVLPCSRVRVLWRWCLERSAGQCARRRCVRCSRPSTHPPHTPTHHPGYVVVNPDFHKDTSGHILAEICALRARCAALGGVAALPTAAAIAVDSREGANEAAALPPYVHEPVSATPVHPINGRSLSSRLPCNTQTNAAHRPGKEYAKADSRYATRDAFVISMEAVTAFAWGPLCFVVACGVLGRAPWRHWLTVLVSLGQLYGDVLYFATCALEGTCAFCVCFVWCYV